ncbi:MAG: ATP-binding cassette domain-containing protein, partial [Spirochaetales bacterium]|nr:ATP-binding cassette domain-containing protein [Spirochaetales bacterium]
MSEVIKLSGVSVIRNKIAILDNISWQVQSGENWAVIGRNGAGKSFLLNVIAGNIFPSQGKVTVLGLTFGETDMLELRRLFGYVSPAFQYNYDGATTVNKVVYSGF